jgi:hypothetical protein
MDVLSNVYQAVPRLTLWSTDHAVHNSQLHSWIWAASQACQLYLELRTQVIKDIMVCFNFSLIAFLLSMYFFKKQLTRLWFTWQESKSKISLVSDVWTTKGSHGAFIGISSCYINHEWKYVCQHLSMKYEAWHHNGKYLATPFANIVVKHGLHQKISINSLIHLVFSFYKCFLAYFLFDFSRPCSNYWFRK